MVEGLVLARAALERGVGLRPADQALVDGKPPEHPARRRVARDDRAALDPGPRQAVRRLEPARARFRPRRRRSRPAGTACSLSSAKRSRPAGAAPRPGASGTSRVGCLSMNDFSSLFGIVRQRSIVVAITSAVGSASVRIDISPKKSPRASRARSCPSITTAPRPRGSRRSRCRPCSGGSRAVPRRRPPRSNVCASASTCGCVQIGEEAQPRQRLDEVVGARLHGAHVTVCRSRRSFGLRWAAHAAAPDSPACSPRRGCSSLAAARTGRRRLPRRRPPRIPLRRS